MTTTKPNPSRTSIGNRAAEIARAKVKETKQKYNLVDKQEIYELLGLTSSQIADYKRYHQLQAHTTVTLGGLRFDLYDLQAVKDAVAARKKRLADKRQRALDKINRPHKKPGPKPKPKTPPAQIIVEIPTKTPIVSTPKPKPAVPAANLRAPGRSQLQEALAQCWNLDRTFARNTWREIVRDYDRQGYKRK